MSISSRRNETLKGIRRLRRRQGESAILEGPHLLREALRAGLDLESVLFGAAFSERPEGVELASRLTRAPLLVDDGLLSELCDSDAPRGVLAVAALPRGGVETLALTRDGLALYLDGVQDPGNLGALARVAEAFGAEALLLATGSCHPNHPRALRASAGSLLRLPVALQATPSAVDARWAASGVRPRWIGLDAHGGEPPRAASSPGACVVALGAERGRLDPQVQARLDARWTIPLAPAVESLNVAVAAGIVLHVLCRSRRD